MVLFVIFSFIFNILMSGDNSNHIQQSHRTLDIEQIYAPFDSLKAHVADYILPIDKRFALTSAFADFRATHFHAGIDFSTFGKIGYPVYASNSGYVSEISVTPYGYGKILYVRHPDGFTTMYAHLQKFNEEIDAFVRKEQYKNGIYPFEIKLKPNNFPVKRGEIIGYTGNTGVGDAHMHFEIRDESMNPVDPLLFPAFATRFQDRDAPRFQRIAFTPLTAGSTVHGSYSTWISNITQKGKNEFTVPNIIYIKGSIGISLKASDYLSSTKYANRANQYVCYLDGKQIFSSQIHRLPSQYFKQISLHYDWTLTREGNNYFQKMYIEHGNRLPFYERMEQGCGIINTEKLESGLHYLRIISSDLYGNSSSLTVILSLYNPALTSDKILNSPENSPSQYPEAWITPISDESDTAITSLLEIMPQYIAQESNKQSNTSLIIKKEFYRDYMTVLVTSHLPLTLRPSLWISTSSRRTFVDLSALDANRYFGMFQFTTSDSGKVHIETTADINNAHDVNAFDDFTLYPIKPELGGSISSADGKYRITFSPGAVYQPLFCRIENSANSYSLLPDDVLLDQGAQVNYSLSEDMLSKRVGLFYSNGMGWTLLDWTAPNNKKILTGKITRFLGEFTLLSDSLPPNITSFQTQYRKGKLLISFRINDPLAGVNARSMRLQLDGKPIIAQYDPYNSTVYFNEPIKLYSGNHRLSVTAKDHMENSVTIDKSFIVR